MNLNGLNSNYKVVSKYFTSNTVMDESLTDFQVKKSFKGPKIVKAAAKAKPKVKKAVKRIKGQKDIRAALNLKKSELIAHAKAFDKECKKSGIDVDSEELQVAIALSKSLQPTENGGNATSSQSIGAQIRAGLIRSDLEAFGFKVPKNKPSTSKKVKKGRKPYKLLLATEEQKQQLIFDRYSQLLFELNNSVTTNKNIDLDNTNLFIYNMATNIEYKDMKDDDVFYVETLVEKSFNNMGCLLKNWSDIPGRPLSPPTQAKSEIIFSEIECSQGEMDVVLSGSLKFSRDILKKKYLHTRKSIDHSIVDEVIDQTHQENDAVVVKEYKNLSPNVIERSEKKDNPIEIINVQNKQLLMLPQPCRSLSPGLFDEDDSIVENNSEIAIESSVKLAFNVDTKQTSDVMDFTQCVNVISQTCINNSWTKKPLSQLSQDVDLTKRISNDFMEITECFGVSSQIVLERIDEHIDLTPHCDINIVAEEDCSNIDHVEHMDLSQSSNTSTDTLPFVFISGKEKDADKSLDGTIILNDDDYLDVKSPIINTEINVADTFEENPLDGPKNYTSITDPNVHSKLINGASTKEISVICLDESCTVDTVEEEDYVDLTQKSDSNDEETSDAPYNNTIHQKNNSSLGKKDDVSVDYDEALKSMNTILYCTNDTNFNNDNNTDLTQNSLEKSNEEVITKSNHSEVLELSDTEINSPKKDKNARNNFDCVGFSVADNLPSFNRISSTFHNTANGSVMSEILLMTDLKRKQSPVKPRSPFEDFLDPISDLINDENLHNNDPSIQLQTPKGTDKYVNVKRPKQTEYIVKTDNVTPMLDYEENPLHRPKNYTSVTNPEIKIDVNSQLISGASTKESSVISLDESCTVGTVEEQDSVDLTQTSDSNDRETSDAPNINTIQQINNSSLGKTDDVSVDYDEALENMNTISYCANYTNFNNNNNTDLTENGLEKSNEKLVIKSNHSEVLELSETEVNSPNKDKNARNNFDCGGFSVVDNLPSFNRISRNTLHNTANGSVMNESLPMVDIKRKQSPVKPRSPFEDFLDPISDLINDENLRNNKPSIQLQTPKGTDKYVNVQTPKQTEYIVKTDNITPMLDYTAMTSPERNKELDKYGLKPFKRKRAIQLLTHLYNQTHPYVESTEELPSPSKRRKQETLSQPSTSEPYKNTTKSKTNSRSPRKASQSPRKGPSREASKEDLGSLNLSDNENEMFMVTREVPTLRNVECDADDWVFQKREKAKLYSCRVPLHIALHNYVSCRGRLHEAILRYEPVSIDVIHKGLAASGHRYDPKDLLKYMDKKCITVETAENVKNKNHY